MLLIFLEPDGRDSVTCFRYSLHVPTAAELRNAASELATGYEVEPALVLLGADHVAVHKHFDQLWTPRTYAREIYGQDAGRHLRIVRGMIEPKER